MLERGFSNIAVLMRCERPSQAPPALFDARFIQADCDLADLADRMTGHGAKPFSICLQGPPGTGKSAYARYLAERMGMEVLSKRTSDLLSMWVGGSEENIAEAFREARDTRSFLIFDEADSLLADRRGAHRSWEVTQVNEMLTQMEMHLLPFACTTNYVEKLDVATLRRFLFKVSLRYSSPEQAAGLFRAYFNMEAAGSAVEPEGAHARRFPGGSPQGRGNGATKRRRRACRHAQGGVRRQAESAERDRVYGGGVRMLWGINRLFMERPSQELDNRTPTTVFCEREPLAKAV